MENEMDEKQQELMYRLSLMEQQMQQIQQQLQVIEQNIVEVGSLNLGLDDMKNPKDKEIFAHMGMGIFVKAKVLSDDLLVDVGNKNFVKKSVSETQRIISQQTEKLEEVKEELGVSMENLQREAQKLLEAD